MPYPRIIPARGEMKMNAMVFTQPDAIRTVNEP